jgi:hypothetical protein
MRIHLSVCELIISLLAAQSLIAQGSYEIRHDTINASGWFGGDNRPGSGPRHVGVGQSVLVDTPLTLNSFSFYFTSRFDYAYNPQGVGHEVTLTLNIRHASGAIIQTHQVIVPATFNGGWVTWSNINLSVSSNTLLIFTAYLVGAYDSNQYTSGHGADANAGYPNGQRYVKIGTSDPDMESWTGWFLHPWDSAFRLEGTIQTVGIDDRRTTFPHRFNLTQNYPNPFNPSTTIRYEIPKPSKVELHIYNVLGQHVATLVSEEQNAGRYTIVWNGRNDEGNQVSSGVYFYRLQAADFVETKKLMLLK